jgi:hypothetical protein
MNRDQFVCLVMIWMVQRDRCWIVKKDFDREFSIE